MELSSGFPGSTAGPESPDTSTDASAYILPDACSNSHPDAYSNSHPDARAQQKSY